MSGDNFAGRLCRLTAQKVELFRENGLTFLLNHYFVFTSFERKLEKSTASNTHHTYEMRTFCRLLQLHFLPQMSEAKGELNKCPGLDWNYLLAPKQFSGRTNFVTDRTTCNIGVQEEKLNRQRETNDGHIFRQCASTGHICYELKKKNSNC